MPIDIEDIVVDKPRQNIDREKSGITVLIDMDVVAYSIGFVCQTTIYTYMGVDYTSKRDLKVAHPQGSKVFDEELYETRVEAESLKYCLSAVKRFVNNVIDVTRADSYKGYLTGEGNFREVVSKAVKYKGNRNLPKPVHFHAIREYLENHFDAFVVEGAEADDYLAIEHTKPYKTVLASIDKDLLQVSGLHYQWNKPDNGVFFVDEKQAHYNFYYQMLIGDNTDNILGCAALKDGVYKTGQKKGQACTKRNGVGEKTAVELLAHCETEQEMYDVVLQQYVNLYLPVDTKVEYRLAVKKAKVWMLQNAYLLWMVREIDDKGNLVMWTPLED